VTSLARLEVNSPKDSPVWRRTILDPATSETLEDSNARGFGVDYTGNLFIRGIIPPRPMLETEVGR
jgi:hypothetical protein